MKRKTLRDHTIQLALILLAVTTITFVACDSSTDSDILEDVEGVISDNHGHTSTLTVDQLGAADAVTLDITGTADHTHNVELTADQVTSVAAGDQVSIDSSESSAEGDSHTHNVTFN
jgi:hypothetical protein